MDETTDVVQGLPARRALLRPRVVRQVHAVPRGHDLAREDPAAHPRRPRPPERPRPAARRERQHQPRHRLAAAADHDLPARPVGRVAHRLGDRAVPPRVRGPHRAGAISRASPCRRPSPSARRATAPAAPRWPTTDADARPRADRAGVAVTINGTPSRRAARASWSSTPPSAHGVYIPRFCYHPRMNPVGMCRMCIVEIDTGRGPALQPSCMIECTPDMKVDTESPRSPRRPRTACSSSCSINHPLDCPVCDKGGECPLQDQTMAYGPGESRFVEEKRHYEKPIPISDLVLPRPRALHPLRPLHPLRQGGGRRSADPLHQPRQRDRGQHLPRRAVRVVLQRQHRADLPGRRADRHSRTGSRPARGTSTQVESTCHGLLGRLPRRRSSRRATRCCATRASTSTRSTGAGCATRAASASRPSTATTASPIRSSRDGDDLVGDPLGRRARPRPPTRSRGRGRPARPTARSPCSAAPGSPTRPPTPGPSWPRA